MTPRGIPVSILVYDLTGISLFLLSLIRQHPVLPYRYQYSTFGRSRLNHRVRDGNGCVP